MIQLDDNDPYYVNVQSFCSAFPRIEHLDFPVHRLEDCQYIIDHLKTNLISVVFRFTIDSEEYDDDEQGEFHQHLVLSLIHI